MTWRPRARWTDDVRSYLRMRWADGLSQVGIAREIQDKFGLPFGRQEVSSEAGRLGLPSRYLKGRQEIIAKRAEGKTAKTIAKEIGLSIPATEYRIRTLVSYGLIKPKREMQISQESFAGRVRRLRISAALTREALGGAINCSGISVGNWETGRSNPNMLNLEALAKALGVSVGVLLHGGEHPLFQAINNQQSRER